MRIYLNDGPLENHEREVEGLNPASFYIIEGHVYEAWGTVAGRPAYTYTGSADEL